MGHVKYGRAFRHADAELGKQRVHDPPSSTYLNSACNTAIRVLGNPMSQWPRQYHDSQHAQSLLVGDPEYEVQAVLDDPAWEKQIHNEVSHLLANVNVQELVKRASALRNDQVCTFQPGNYLGAGAIMGCANYHGWLLFDDGEQWLVRIPRTGLDDVANEVIEYIVASEYATLTFLESTHVPAPKVFGYALASDPDNRVGVSYLLIQALPGTPYVQDEATMEMKGLLFGQLAEILIELHRHPFPKAGSLIVSDGKVEVSAAASNRFVALGRYGPFETALDYFVGIAEHYLDPIADGQLYHEYPTKAFLFYTTLRDNAHKLVSREDPGVFYLKHVHDKGNHLLVDDRGTITGIIDWQFTRCVPACEAFGPSYVTADLNALYAGEAGTTDDDRLLARELRSRGAESLGECMERSEMARRFHHGLASD